MIIPIFDGHNDSLTKYYFAHKNFLEKNSEFNLDFPRAKQGGFSGGFFAIFVPEKNSQDKDPREDLVLFENGVEVKYASPIEHDYAKQITDIALELLKQFEQHSQGQLKIIHQADELEKNIKNKVMSALVHFEGAVSCHSCRCSSNLSFDKKSY